MGVEPSQTRKGTSSYVRHIKPIIHTSNERTSSANMIYKSPVKSVGGLSASGIPKNDQYKALKNKSNTNRYTVHKQNASAFGDDSNQDKTSSRMVHHTP